MTLTDIKLILPEILLGVTLLALIFSEVVYRKESFRLVTLMAIFGLVAACVQTFVLFRQPSVFFFSNAMTYDGVAVFFKRVGMLTAILCIAGGALRNRGRIVHWNEYCIQVIAMTLALCFLASANHLILFFLSFLLISTMGILLAALPKRSVLAAEAAYKFMVLGTVSVMLMMIGFVMLYLITKSFFLNQIHQSLSLFLELDYRILICFVLILLGLVFLSAVFPMNLWVPDYFEGSWALSVCVTAVMMLSAGMVMSIRFFLLVFSRPTAIAGIWEALPGLDWPTIIAVLSGLTMLIGSLVSIRQTNARRMLGYLFVANAGFQLLGILVLDQFSISTLLFSLIVMLVSLVVISLVLMVFSETVSSDWLKDYRGLLHRRPFESIVLLLALASLVGLPPMPGFIAKFSLLESAYRHGWHGLTIVGVFAVVLCTYALGKFSYSLVGPRESSRGVIVPEKSGESVFMLHIGERIFLLALTAIILAMSFFADLIFRWADLSLQHILW